MKMYDYAHYLNEIEKYNADTILFSLIGVASLMGAVLIIVLVTFLVSTIIKGPEDLRGSLLGSHSFFVVLAILIGLVTASIMNGGFRVFASIGERGNDITTRYLKNAKQVVTIKTVPIYSFNTGNSEKIEGNISGSFLFISGGIKTKHHRLYNYVVKKADGYQVLDLNSEYKIDNDKQVYINESSDKPSLVIKSYQYEDDNFNTLLNEQRLQSMYFSSPLKKDKFIFNVPKGTVTAFKAE